MILQQFPLRMADAESFAMSRRILLLMGEADVPLDIG